MIPIFICDDDPAYLRTLKNTIEACIKEEELDFAVKMSCTDPNDIINYLEDNTPGREVFFLDYELNDYYYNGIKLGIAARRTRPDCFIIYVTSYSEASYLTYHHEINSMDYILKKDPNEVSKKIRRVLVKIQEEIKQYPDSKSAFLYKDHFININTLVYVCAVKGLHWITFYNENGEFNISGSSIAEIKKLLPEDFFQCNRGILINLKKVKYIDEKGKTIYFRSGHSCQASASRLNELKKNDSYYFYSKKERYVRHGN